MSESLKYASDKKGLGPGSLVHVGNVHQSATQMTVVRYNNDQHETHSVTSTQELLAYRDTADSITWVIVEGLADASIIESIGNEFGIHPLVSEDILNTHQRPKLEDHDDYLFVVLKSLVPNHAAFSVIYEQVSLVVMRNVVFIFKEKADSLLDPVLKRLQNSRGRLRKTGTDFLMYTILDTIVDLNFDLMDQLEETLTALENEVFSQPTPASLEKIHDVKRALIKMRRYLAPIRDLLAGMLRSESELLDAGTHIYLRDVYDHVLRIVESVETHRDILTSLIEIYLSTISSRMNEVMKVLTIFASIFIPLTFITGIYGMNFEHMPELAWKWGYPGIWLVFIVSSSALYLFFRKRGWT